MPTTRRDTRLRDRIAPGVRVLFVGINPGIRSAQTGHHFAGYSNRFWKLLYESRLVPEPMTFKDDDRLPEFGYGITNIVARATPGMTDLHADEYQQGARVLLKKIEKFRPEIVAIVGVTVYRALLLSLGDSQAMKRTIRLGLQKPPVAFPTKVFVLPNPSGRNANYTYEEMLAAFRSLRRAVNRRASVHNRQDSQFKARG
ncbi:MAG TPA: mismatch-specific DNA-glycosylase [Vicinamibacterales bacterium]|nr:mismatch-specific DNA-glycosylase [Vicinamibacterales bacterium]